MSYSGIRLTMSQIRTDYFKTYKTKLTTDQYSKFLRDVHYAFIDYIVDGNILYLPYNLGNIKVKKHKPKKSVDEDEDGNYKVLVKNIDFGETWKLRQEIKPEWSKQDWKQVPKEDRPVVIYDNSHTDGYRYKIVWDRSGCSVKNLRHFRLKPSVRLKRQLIDRLRSNNTPAYYDYD